MSRARELSKLGNINALAVDTTDTEVGIASTVPSSTLDVRGEVKIGTAVQLGVAGVVTATSFSGSGSNLTGLATTETVRTDTLTVAGVSTLTGAVNVDATTDSTSSSTGALIVDGGLGVAKNVYIGAGLSVAGTLTYEDVTNVDSVGLITAKSGVNVSGGQLLVGSGVTIGIAGVSTFSGTSDIHLLDSVRLNVGDASDLAIYHDGSNSFISDSGTGGIKLMASDVYIKNASDADMIHAQSGGAVKIYHNGNQKFETTNDGTVTTGIGTFTGGIDLSGDNDAAIFGAGGDLQIYHDGTNNILRNIGTRLDVIVNSSETAAVFNPNGSVDLYYDNTKKLATTNEGTVTTGIATATGLDVADKITHTGDTNTAIRFPANDTISFETAAEEHCRVVDTGNFLVGATAVEDWDGSRSHRIQVRGTSSNNAGVSALITANDDNPSELVLGKSRGTGNTIVQSADDVGQIRFAANDGAGFHSIAYVRASMDGTPGSDDLPSKLTFGTSADGGTTVSERLRIDSSGNINFGANKAVALPSGTGIQVYNSSVPRIKLVNDTTGNASGDGLQIYMSGSAAIFDQKESAEMRFYTAGTERTRIDSSGRLLVGHTASIGEDRIFQIVGTTSDNSSAQLIRHSSDTAASKIDFAKSRNGTKGSFTILQDGDVLGDIIFRGDDGTDLNSEGVKISAVVDGTPGSNDMPSRLVFATSADGSASPTERLRIDKEGGFIFSNGALLEKVNITAGKLSANTNIDLDDGMVHYFTTQETTTSTPNIRVNSSTSLNDIMTAGDVITVTLVTTAAAGGYSANMTIDGNAITEEWVGGSAPSAGGSDGLDVYSYTIICTHASNTGDSGFKVIANYINATN